MTAMRRRCKPRPTAGKTEDLLAASFEDIAIIGGGKYGSKAIKALRDRARSIVVIDNDPFCPASSQSDRVCGLGDRAIFAGGTSFILADGASALLHMLSSGAVPDYVIPCAPQNVMAQLFKAWAASKGLLAISDEEETRRARHSVPKEVLVREDAERGLIVTSFSKGKPCSPLCLEGDYCPISGESRPTSMFALLSSKITGDACMIFQSRLLAPEVGGIGGRDIADAFSSLSPKLCDGTRLAIGTACACHGIIDFMSLRRSLRA